MRRFRGEEGSALVEFALCSSILFMSLFGIFALCGALYSYNFVSDAAREATRYALVRGSACTGFSDCGITQAELNTYVKSLGYPGINTANLSATASWSGNYAPANSPGNIVTVTVTYSDPLNIPFWPKTGSVLSLKSTSQMTISQ
jgi:Flp pilus assembly protein TadG